MSDDVKISIEDLAQRAIRIANRHAYYNSRTKKEMLEVFDEYLISLQLRKKERQFSRRVYSATYDVLRKESSE